MTKGQQLVKTITRPQFEALRTAGPIAEWQDLPAIHALACLKERHAVFAQRSTIEVLKRLGLAEVAEGDISEGTGLPWDKITALTPAGELIAAALEEGSELPTLDYIIHVVETMADAQPDRSEAGRPSRYSVTEEYRADRAAVWTARVGRTVAVEVISPQERGMWDTDLLRKALAEHAGVRVDQVRPVRARNDVQVAPRVWEVTPAGEDGEQLAL